MVMAVGSLFGRIMGMMMMQNKMFNTQRERQYKSESEQREQEYQLCWEEMAIAHEEACPQRQMMSAQSQMMNAIFMLMLNKNGGTRTTCHLALATLRKY